MTKPIKYNNHLDMRNGRLRIVVRVPEDDSNIKVDISSGSQHITFDESNLKALRWFAHWVGQWYDSFVSSTGRKPR